MGKMKSGLFSWVKVLAYPFVRPARDLRESAEALRESARSARQSREERKQQAKEINQLLRGHSPQEKFEQTYEAWGWDEQALRAQLVAAHRTRIAAVSTGVLGFLAILLLMLFVHSLWFRAVLAGIALLLGAGGVLHGMRYAWWEYSLETRTMTPFRSFLGRADLLKRVFSLGPANLQALEDTKPRTSNIVPLTSLKDRGREQ